MRVQQCLSVCLSVLHGNVIGRVVYESAAMQNFCLTVGNGNVIGRAVYESAAMSV